MEIAFCAVRSNPSLLKYIDSNIDNYKEIATLAVKQDDTNFKYVDTNSQEYPYIALHALEQNIKLSQYIKDAQLREILTNIIRNPINLKHLIQIYMSMLKYACILYKKTHQCCNMLIKN